MGFRRIFVAVLGTLLAASVVIADAPQTGVVTGVVRDPNDAPLPGATVQLQGDRGSQSTVTGAEGEFRFVFAVPGSYTVRADLEGFQSAEGGIVVSAGGRAFVELQLGETIGGEIVVTGELPLISKYDVSATSTVEAKVGEELVFASRTYRSQLSMFPGVVQGPASLSFDGRTPSVNGAYPTEFASFIDGVDVSVTRTGGVTRMFLPTSALAEVGVEAAGYTAEYGRMIGGFNRAVTKSGTNEFHGSFQYVAHNQKWGAQSDHVPLEREDDIQGRFEVSLGGPIMRDKLWFFVAASDSYTNQLTALGSGDAIDSSIESESQIVKLDWSPSPSHKLAISGIRAPFENNFVRSSFYDRYTVPLWKQGGEFVTGSWNWAIDDDKYFELRAARQTGAEERERIWVREVDPSAGPDDPPGNIYRYLDLLTVYFHNGLGVALGGLDFPREQANAAFTWFTRRHELKFGIDYQDARMESLFIQDPVYYGRGYNEALPGGFALPIFKRVYHPAEAPVDTATTAINLFVQDRFDVGDKWTVTVGLRLEDQEHTNDKGETVITSTDVAPRLAAIHDVGGDGTMLLKATLGRYYSLIDQNTINTEYSTSPNGSNAYDQYGWNRLTGLYDKFQRTVLPSPETAEGTIDPFYKDEVTLGLDWQFAPMWVFKARAIYWEVNDQYSKGEQFDENGEVFRVVWNIPEAEREYKGLQLELNRRYRNNWVLRSNYTLSRVEGNCFVVGCTFMEGRAVVDPETGVPITAINRYGPAGHDVTHIFNLAGSKTWPVGRHSFKLGGYFYYRTSAAWNFTEAVELVHPVSGQTITSTFNPEPQGSRRLGDNYVLNLNGTWDFPVAGPLEGSLRVEVANVTDQQEQINVNSRTGEPDLVRRSWQKPREFRVVVGLTF